MASMTRPKGYTETQLSQTYFEPQCVAAQTAAPGIEGRLLMVLGVDNDPSTPTLEYLDEPNTDLLGNGSGALYREFAALHQGSCTHGTAGVGAYDWNRVVNLSQYSALDLAKTFRGLENWWP
jgi:hypothetical protein